MATTPAGALLGAEGEPASGFVPGERADRAAAGAAHHRLLGVGETDGEDHAVLVADRHHLVLRVAGDAGREHLAGAELERRLAHRPVLGMERPEHGGIGAGGGEEPALRRPRHRPWLGRVAAHPHVLAVGKPPAVEGVVLHGGDDILAVRREADAEMGALPLERRRRRLGRRPPQGDAVVAGDGEPRSLRRKGDAARGAGQVEAPFAPVGEADGDLAAGGEGDGVAGAGGDVVDPLPRALGDAGDGAGRVGRGDEAVVAAGDEAPAVDGARGGQDRAGMDRDARLGLAGDEAHRAVAKGEGGGLAEEDGVDDEGGEGEALGRWARVYTTIAGRGLRPVGIRSGLTRNFLGVHIMPPKITFDPAKREATLKERGIDFLDAARSSTAGHTRSRTDARTTASCATRRSDSSMAEW